MVAVSKFFFAKYVFVSASPFALLSHRTRIRFDTTIIAKKSVEEALLLPARRKREFKKHSWRRKSGVEAKPG